MLLVDIDNIIIIVIVICIGMVGVDRVMLGEQEFRSTLAYELIFEGFIVFRGEREVFDEGRIHIH